MISTFSLCWDVWARNQWATEGAGVVANSEKCLLTIVGSPINPKNVTPFHKYTGSRETGRRKPTGTCFRFLIRKNRRIFRTACLIKKPVKSGYVWCYPRLSLTWNLRFQSWNNLEKSPFYAWGKGKNEKRRVTRPASTLAFHTFELSGFFS